MTPLDDAFESLGLLGGLDDSESQFTPESIAVITRCRNEPFIHEFVAHYLAEGVSHVYIIDDKSSPDTYERIADADVKSVTIVRDIPFRNGPEVGTQYRRIRNDYDWVIVVDADEYITTRRRPGSTIAAELGSTFASADHVKVPWVMMGFNGVEHNPSVLLRENVWRRNYDDNHIVSVKENADTAAWRVKKKFNRIGQVKSIFRTKSFAGTRLHNPQRAVGRPRVVDAIDNCKPPAHDDLQLTEDKIERGHLVCYHYRVVSKDHIRWKIANSKLEGYSSSASFQAMLDFDFPEIRDTTLADKLAQRKPRV